jgi:hypothetical protein
MKKILLLQICLAFFFLGQSQVTENVRTMSKGNENALSIFIESVNKSQVVDTWNKTMKRYSKTRTELSAANNELFTDNAEIKDLSENPIDIYATTIEKSSGGVELIVWFYLGGAYLSSAKHPEQFLAAKKFLIDFAQSAHKTALEETLVFEEKKLRELQGTQRTLVNKGDNLVQDIARLERQIEDAKVTLEANKVMVSEQEAVVKEQEKIVEKLKQEIKKG